MGFIFEVLTRQDFSLAYIGSQDQPRLFMSLYGKSLQNKTFHVLIRDFLANQDFFISFY